MSKALHAEVGALGPPLAIFVGCVTGVDPIASGYR